MPLHFFEWDEAKLFWCSTDRMQANLVSQFSWSLIYIFYTSSILLHYVVTFKFVYILPNSDSFAFLVNWPTIQFLNSCFSKSNLLLGVPPHLRKSKACISGLLIRWFLTIQMMSYSKYIDYRLRSDTFRWYCLFYLLNIVDRRH